MKKQQVNFKTWRQKMKTLTFILWSFFLISCATTPYRQAKKANSKESYEQFLQENPISTDSLKAAKRLEKLYHKFARENPSLASYSAVLNRFPKGKYAKKASEGFEKAFFDILQSNLNEKKSCEDLSRISKRLTEVDHIIDQCKGGDIIVLSLYESLAFEYLKAGLYKEARLSLAMATEQYNQIGSTVFAINKFVGVLPDPNSKSALDTDFDSIVESYKRINRLLYQDLEFLHKVENQHQLQQFLDILKMYADNEKGRDDKISATSDLTQGNSDSLFCHYALDYFSNISFEYLIPRYVIRFDANASCYLKIKNIMREEPIQFSAIDALQYLGEPFQDNLLEVIENDTSSSARVHAALGLAWMPPDSSILDFLENSLEKEKDDKVKLATYFALEKLGRLDDLEPVLYPVIQIDEHIARLDGFYSKVDETLREMALSLLRYTRNEIDGNRLCNILTYGNSTEKEYACQVVANCAYSDSLGERLLILLSSEYQKVRQEARDALEKFYPQSLEMLIRGLQDSNPYVRENCITLLANGNNFSGHEAVISYLQNERHTYSISDYAFYRQEAWREYADELDKAERRAATVGGYIPDWKKEEFFNDMAQNMESQFKGNIFLACAAIKYEPAKSEIIHSLRNEALSRHAAFALCVYNDPTLIPLLRHLFEKPKNDMEKLSAAFVLSAYQDDNAMAYVIKQLRGGNSDALVFVQSLQPVQVISVIEEKREKLISEIKRGIRVDANKPRLRELCSLLTKLYAKKYAV